MHDLKIVRGTQLVSRLTNEQNHVAGLLEKLSGNVFWILDESDHADRRRRIDCARGALVVQTDISPRHGDIELSASFGHAFDSFAQLQESFPAYRGFRN